LTRRREKAHEERRKPRVEVNLLAESEGGRVITKTRRGCTFPFLGTALLLIVLEAVRAGLG
jgi:hypothetical protein